MEAGDGHWDLDRTLEIAAMDALRLPPWRCRHIESCRVVNVDGWPCVGCFCQSRICCCSMNRPTTSMRNRWPGWRRFLEEYPGTVIAVTHDRYFLDNVAGMDPGTGPRARHPMERQLFFVAGAERASDLNSKRNRTVARHSYDETRTRMGPHVEPKRAVMTKARGAHLQRFEELSSREVQESLPETNGDLHSTRTAAR